MAVQPQDAGQTATVHKFSREFHKTQWIPLGNLCVKWAQSQREFKQKQADDIAANFDPDLFGALAVSLADARGKHHVIDGQHRREGALGAFDEATKVPCFVLPCSDPVRAAELFDKINTTRRAVKPLEKFKTRVTAKEPDYVAVNGIVEAVGYSVKNVTGRGCIRCVEALMRTYMKFGGEALRRSLEVIRDTWGVADDSAMSGPIVAGYGILIGQHGDQIQYERLIDKVAKRYTPQRLWGAARQRRDMLGGSAGSNVKSLLFDAYNAGLRGGKGKLVNGAGAPDTGEEDE